MLKTQGFERFQKLGYIITTGLEMINKHITSDIRKNKVVAEADATKLYVNQKTVT